MTLTSRLAVAMIALVAVTVAAVGWLSYRGLEHAILPRVLDRIETHARLVAADLQSSVRGARADVAAFRSATALNGLIRAHLAGGVDPVDGLSEKTWRERIAERLSAELEAKPAYAEFRVIGVDDGQREVVRADRKGSNDAVQIVPHEELQGKGDRTYFKETIRLRPGEIYVSPLNLTGDNGVVKTPHVPTLRVATPVFAPDGKPFGIVIINIDMLAAFDRVRSSVRQGGKIYVVNARGDYLVHPDPAREFGSQLGKPTNWQTDFPDLASSPGATQSASQIEQDQSGHSGAIAFAPAVLAGNEWVAVIETVSNAVFMAPAATIRNTSLLVGLIAVLSAAALAVLVARSLTRPISQLTAAVEGIGRSDPVAIPVDASGETGVLARAFAHVMGEVSAKAAALQREIEEHRQTEVARRQTAERERVFSASVESSNDAIVTKSLDGIITGWNPAAERLFGFTALEAVGKSIDIIVPPNRLSEMHDILRRIGRGEKIEHHETIRTRKDGGLVEVSLGISPIKTPSGAIVGASKTARDISETKRTREALLESEQLARGIIDTALDAFVQIDESTVIVDWNPQAEAIFGWSRQDAIGQKFGKLIVAESDRADLGAALKRFRHSGRDQILGRRREIMARRRDGGEFRAEMSVTALKRREGFLFNSFFRDLTDKIAAEDRIRQTEKMEAVGQLTGGIGMTSTIS